MTKPEISSTVHSLTPRTRSGPLDWIGVIAQHLRLLVLGPLAVGLAAGAMALAWPRTYESSAVLKGTQQMASLFVTAQVIDPVIVKLGLQGSQESIDDARVRLKKEDIKAVFNMKDNLVTVMTKGRSKEQAQALLTELLQVYFAQSKPKGAELQRLQALLESVSERLKEANATARHMNQKLSREDAKSGADTAQGYATLVASIDTLERKQQEILKELQGADESQVVQFPAIDVLKTSPKPLLLAVMMALTCLFVLLCVVFVKHALWQASRDQDGAIKLARIRDFWRQAWGRA